MTTAPVAPATSGAVLPELVSNDRNATSNTATSAPDVARNPSPSLGRGITLPKIGALTPEISLIIDGKYSAQSQNPESLTRGFVPAGVKIFHEAFLWVKLS